MKKRCVNEGGEWVFSEFLCVREKERNEIFYWNLLLSDLASSIHFLVANFIDSTLKILFEILNWQHLFSY